ncbi:MAG TPA: MurR/RpiR family transcriptional regulator [Ramlibacter sp.]|nr:MurR/RpiR family transcriptional regulator [Ramlibacter sp.]
MATLTGNPSMAQRIARALPALTRAHRHIADYVLAHPLQAATMPIDELAATVGVSVATANRFARALEFDGYPQFRAALVLGFETTLAPVEKLRSKLEGSATVSDVLSTTLAGIQRNIASTRQALDPHTCERAVDAILKAQRICVVGFGSSSWLAGLLQRSLDPYCENVQLLATIEGSSFGAKALTRLQPRDLLIAIAFPRYLADTVLLARHAREGGVPVLALTDRVTSPLARLGTVSLYAHTDSQYFANSDASVLALIEALCGAVAHRAKGSLKAATQVAESVLPWLHDSHSGRLRPVADAVAPGQGKLRRAKSPKATK